MASSSWLQLGALSGMASAYPASLWQSDQYRQSGEGSPLDFFWYWTVAGALGGAGGTSTGGPVGLGLKRVSRSGLWTKLVPGEGHCVEECPNPSQFQQVISGFLLSLFLVRLGEAGTGLVEGGSVGLAEVEGGEETGAGGEGGGGGEAGGGDGGGGGGDDDEGGGGGDASSLRRSAESLNRCVH